MSAQDRQTQFEGDESGRCGGCGSREMTTTRLCDSQRLIGRCHACDRIQDVETRDWPESEPCDDCAFRKGSPEQSDPWEWMKIREIVESGQPFHCHKGLPFNPETGKYEAPDVEKGRVTVCAGWLNAHVAHLRKAEDRIGESIRGDIRHVESK